MSAGISVIVFIPIYYYGATINRSLEQNYNHYYYQWTHGDKRNRLTHNLVMEHFEVHKEQLEDLIVDMNTQGSKAFAEIDDDKPKDKNYISADELALIDEISGLTNFLDNFLIQQNLPQVVRSRIESHINRYSGEKSREVAMNEMRIALMGPQGR